MTALHDHTAHTRDAANALFAVIDEHRAAFLHQHPLPTPVAEPARDDASAPQDDTETADVEHRLDWSQMSDDRLLRDLLDLSRDEGAVISVNRIRGRYGIGAGRAGRLQTNAREEWATN